MKHNYPLIDWLQLSIDEIKNGVGADNIRYLHHFRQDYLRLFGLDLGSNIGCGSCVSTAVIKLKNYLKDLNAMDNQEKKNNAALKLKPFHSPLRFLDKESGEVMVFANDTLTDKDILFILNRHPSAAWFFEGFRSKFNNKDAAQALLDAKAYFEEKVTPESSAPQKAKKKKPVAAEEDILPVDPIDDLE